MKKINYLPYFAVFLASPLCAGTMGPVTTNDTQVFFSLGAGYSQTKIDIDFFSPGEESIAPNVNLLNKNVQIDFLPIIF